jgi:hypothetical protein
MHRALALFAFFAGAAAIAIALVDRRASASLDEDVFTSREVDVRMLAPRGWRVSETATYPGILLWMKRSKPPAEMLLTVEDIGPSSRACWPKACGHEATVPDFVCVLTSRLRDAGFQLGPVEDGRWFDYQRGKDADRFLRQGVVLLGHHAFTLILAAPTANDRAAQARTFDRALRSLRPLSASSEAATTPPSADGTPAPTSTPVASAGAGDAGGDASAAGPSVRVEGADDARGANAPARRPAPSTAPSDAAPPAASDGGDQAVPSLVPIDAPPPAPDAGVPPIVEEVPPCAAP